jgi:hypothetical protein
MEEEGVWRGMCCSNRKAMATAEEGFSFESSLYLPPPRVLKLVTPNSLLRTNSGASPL